MLTVLTCHPLLLKMVTPSTLPPLAILAATLPRPSTTFRGVVLVKGTLMSIFSSSGRFVNYYLLFKQRLAYVKKEFTFDRAKCEQINIKRL